MKQINTNNLSDIQHEFLSHLCDDLAILDERYPDDIALLTEIEVSDLREDEDGVIYAPTKVKEFLDLSPRGDEYNGGSMFVMNSELAGYKPLLTIFKERQLTV